MRLSSFVFATLRRQHLATAVQAMSPLYYPQAKNRHCDVVQSVEDADGLFRQAAQRLGGYLPEVCGDRLTFADFNELAIAIMPNLSQLYLEPHFEWDTEEKYSLTDWPYPLPALTCLVLRGAQGDPREEATYHLYQARNLIRQAPNLRVLIAPDCVAGSVTELHEMYMGEPWDVPLNGLRTLSLNGIGMDQLATVLLKCPVLQDLEYFGESAVLETLCPERHLGHVKTTLRRLCWSQRQAGRMNFEDYDIIAQDLDLENCINPDDAEAAAEDDADVQRLIEFEASLANDHPGLSMASFPVLEILELEQLVLYGPCLTGPIDDAVSSRARRSPYALTVPNDLFARFPPSIRRLRVGAIFHWPTIYDDLLTLAAEPSRFPRLKSITLEVLRSPPEHQVMILTNTLRDLAGIMVSVFRVARGSWDRGLLPVRPGHFKRTPEPLVYGFEEWSSCPSWTDTPHLPNHVSAVVKHYHNEFYRVREREICSNGPDQNDMSLTGFCACNIGDENCSGGGDISGGTTM
jgi:hypothetical protein